jgi:hypothetical protein
MAPSVGNEAREIRGSEKNRKHDNPTSLIPLPPASDCAASAPPQASDRVANTLARHRLLIAMQLLRL